MGWHGARPPPEPQRAVLPTILLACPSGEDISSFNFSFNAARGGRRWGGRRSGPRRTAERPPQGGRLDEVKKLYTRRTSAMPDRSETPVGQAKTPVNSVHKGLRVRLLSYAAEVVMVSAATAVGSGIGSPSSRMLSR
jgi:hypothetical protein